MDARSFDTLRDECIRILNEWLSSCTRGKKISRNTVAVGIVVLDHFRRSGNISKDDVISQGGEIKGARSGLGNVLESYNIPSTYLKEVTTRQAHPDGQRLFEAYGWGSKFTSLSLEEKEQLFNDLITILNNLAFNWLNRQNLKLNLDRRDSPLSWINLIIQNAKQRSGGIVEQHLVGAKLERRFPLIEVPNHPAHAADIQTSREGDFSLTNTVYHVTATPSRDVIQKCSENLKIGLHPILLVPDEQKYRATALAQDEEIDSEITIISIESFVSQNIIELATQENREFFGILQDIVDIYNRRLAEVETDLSLQIQIR